MESIILTQYLLVNAIAITIALFIVLFIVVLYGICDLRPEDVALVGFCICCIVGLIALYSSICPCSTEDKSIHKSCVEVTCECCECKQKITESQYQEAKDLVEEYEKQTNQK